MVEKPQRSVTLKVSADRLDLSVNTISKALRGKDGVGEATRQAVLAEARKLGYRPNRHARSLVAGRSHTIALINGPRSDPYFGRVAIEMERAAVQRGYRLIELTPRVIDEEPNAVVDRLMEWDVDGVVAFSWWPHMNRQLDQALVQEGIPLVVRGVPGPPGVDVVALNWEAAGDIGTDHLLRIGYPSVGYFGLSHDVSDQRHEDARLKGYRRALERHGMAVHPDWICPAPPNLDGAYAAARKFLQRANRPRAAFCHNAPVAIALMRAANEMGLSIPGDLAVAAFGDSDILDFLPVRVSVIDSDIRQYSERATDLLIRRIEGYRGPSTVEVLPVHLIVRESCGGLGSQPVE